jgi:hypothetical protein
MSVCTLTVVRAYRHRGCPLVEASTELRRLKTIIYAFMAAATEQLPCYQAIKLSTDQPHIRSTNCIIRRHAPWSNQNIKTPSSVCYSTLAQTLDIIMT